MNWVDWAIIAVLLLFASEGWGRSLILEVFDFLSFVWAFLLSLRFYNLAGDLFESSLKLPHSLSHVLGFITIWFATEAALFALARIFLPGLQRLVPKAADKVLGVVPSFLKGLVFVAVFLVLVATFPIQPKLKKDVNSSLLGSLILSRAYQLEAPLKSVFGGITNETLTFLTVKPQANESVDLGFRSDKFHYDGTLESKMVELVNQERVKAGLSALRFDASLREVGRNHSADMFQRGYFSHYSPEGETVAQRASRLDVDYAVIGENLAFAPSVELAHQGFMNSPGHKANILSPDYNRIGIGAANGDEFGIMFTQVFAD